MLERFYISEYIENLIAKLRKPLVIECISIAIILACFVSFFVTYKTITESNNILGPNPYKVMAYIILDLSLLIILSLITVRSWLVIWINKRTKRQASRLQNRVLLLFIIVAGVPTIIVALFSAIFFHIGLQSWFNQGVEVVLKESVVVAEAYLQEHKEVLRGDVLAIASGIEKNSVYLKNTIKLKNYLDKQMDIHSLTEAVVFERKHIIAGTKNVYMALLRNIPPEVFIKANQGHVALITFDNNNTVRALVKLDKLIDTYLMVGRAVDMKVLEHIRHTKGAASEYKNLYQHILDLQLELLLIYILLAAILLIVAIWFGFIFSKALIEPLNNLVDATDQVTKGNLDIKITEGPDNDEIGVLERRFNTMVEQLKEQHKKLANANISLDRRRHFNELIISGVSTGIMAVNREGKVILANEPALQCIEMTGEATLRKDFADILPEAIELLDEARCHPEEPSVKELTILRGGKKKNILLKISIEQDQNTETGFIVTFDDITALLAAQRNAAWSDVARRIAHEIKNPLTPIHLAAERLKSKFKDEVKDKTNFLQYTETIVRRVHDVNIMVEEFVNFARMPLPEMKKEDIVKLLQEVIFSRKCIDQNIEYEFITNFDKFAISCDASQITQVMTNIIKNAEESIIAHDKKSCSKIIVTLQKYYDMCKISVEDSGKGFPPELLAHLTEPYVTTRARGTGLGLAIVKKIIEDHNGSLNFASSSLGGGSVTIMIPVNIV